MKNRIILVAIAAMVCVWAGTANALVAQYNSGVVPQAGAAGAADPVSQGWTFYGASPPNQYAAGYDSGNGGWRTVDGTTSAPAYYQYNISAQDAANMIFGWTYTAVLSMDSDARGSAGGFVDNYYLPPNHGRQKDIYLHVETVDSASYLLQFTIDASKNLWANDGTTNHKLTTDGSAYDNFKILTITYDGTNAVLSHAGNNFALTGRTNHTSNRVVMGAVSTPDQGSAIWNAVSLENRTVFYDSFEGASLGDDWEVLVPGAGYGIDTTYKLLWGNLMVLRVITDKELAAGDVITITVDRNREGTGYTYSGDIIAWNGVTATVIGSFSFMGGTDPASFTTDPITNPALAGQKLGFTFSHSVAWGETNSIRLDCTSSPGTTAKNPDPADNATEVPIEKVLSWSAPLSIPVASFDVFVDPNALNLNAANADYFSLAQTALTFNPPGDLNYGKQYFWRVDTREPGGTVHTGNVWTFTTLPPNPKITVQPENQLVFAGEQAEFVTAAINPFTSDNTGLSYQWYKVGGPPDVPVGTNLPVYTIPNATLAEAGQYYCKISIVSPPEGIGYVSQTNNAKLIIKRLLGQWNFEDNLNDASGNGYNGTPVGTTPVFTAFPADPSRAVTGKALECIVGTGNYVQVPAAVFNDVDTQITVSLWTHGVDQPNAGNEHTLLATDDSGAIVLSMMIPHSTARIWTRIGNPVDGVDAWYEGASAATDWFSGKWNHWVVTKDSKAGLLRVYYNGRLWLESTDAFKAVYGATKFYIGGGDAAGAFGGLIDDVRLYNYAMTAAEIAAISPRPMLPDPTDGQTNVMFDTNLKWNPGDGSSKYRVYFSDTLDPDPNIWLLNPTELDTTVPDADTGINLKLGTQYWWYVQEYDNADNLLWTSDLWDFTVRLLNSDMDDNDAVNLSDFASISTQWQADTRQPKPVLLVDSCIYDPNNKDRNDPASYANHWDTYWTATGGIPGGSTGGNKLYGTAYCEAITDPNKAIAWHYDTSTSTGGTDTNFYYRHRTRPRLPLNQFNDICIDIMATPGSSLKDPYTFIVDNDGDVLDYVIPISVLGDNKWHTITIPVDTLSGIGDMDNLSRIQIGIWGASIKGVWYMKNLRVLSDGGVVCILEYHVPQDINFDCKIDMTDLMVLVSEWMLDARNP